MVVGSLVVFSHHRPGFAADDGHPLRVRRAHQRLNCGYVFSCRTAQLTRMLPIGCIALDPSAILRSRSSSAAWIAAAPPLAPGSRAGARSERPSVQRCLYSQLRGPFVVSLL
jgi:hypothetical protein